MSYEEVIDSLLEKHQSVPHLKRLLKPMRKGFRPKSPKDIDKATFVSTLLWVIGFDGDAILLLRYVETHTSTEGGARNIYGSLAFCRLVLAQIYEERGEPAEVLNLMSQDDIDAGFNLAVDSNPVREILHVNYGDWNYLDNDPETTPKVRLQSAYFMLLTSIVLIRRFDEVAVSYTHLTLPTKA